MLDMMLSLSVVPVGPRDAFKRVIGETWRFALQVSVGFTQQPREDQRVSWGNAMLPWIALDSDKKTTIKIAWQLFPSVGTPVKGTANAELQGAISLPLRREIEDPAAGHDGAWRRFVRDQPPESFVMKSTKGPVETTNRNILLPPVLQAFGGSTPEIASSALQCMWYFDVPVTEELAAKVNRESVVGIAAWPIRYVDTREAPVEFRFRDGLFEFNDRTVLVGYVPTQGDGVARAQVLPFPLRRFAEQVEPALATYWLPSRDSRLDSLAAIEDFVAHALNHRALIAALTPELLVKAGITRPKVTDAITDAREFIERARKAFGEDTPADPAEVQKLIRAALSAKKDFGRELRAGIARRLVKTVNDAAGVNGTWPVDTPSFAVFADFLVPDSATIRPVLPGEGIDVLLGDAQTRLRHDDSAETGNDSDHAQIAELGVLVRRAPTEIDLFDRDWSLATASVAVLDNAQRLDGNARFWGSEQPETIPHTDKAIVRGVKSVFINGLTSTDITYLGMPLVAATIGSGLHGEVGKEKQPTPDMKELLPLSFQAVGPVRNEIDPSQSPFCMVPPLRYGDWYQFAGFVIDRAGGVPMELTAGAARPLSSAFRWDLLKAHAIPALDNPPPEPPQYLPIQFLRRVPVGEINVRPIPNAAPEKAPEWPALPSGVILRSREWLSAHAPKSESAPALLLSDGDDFVVKNPLVRFRVSPPVLDEHTITRWMMPQALFAGEDPARAQAELVKLNEVLTDIHQKRDAAPPDKPDWKRELDVLPFDPAVSRIGLRCIIVDESGLSSETRRFLAAGHVTLSATFGSANSVDAEGDITLAPGSFAVLELVPLVSTSDFVRRFEEEAMRELVEDEPWVDGGEEFQAFRPARVLVEAATKSLPPADALYDALNLSELANGAIDVSLVTKDGLPLAAMAFVDRYELARQRWVWRNRPIFLAERDANGNIVVSSGEPRQSELPSELGATGRDDQLRVLKFDVLAELDRGLVDRGRIGGRVNRAADSTPLPAPRLMIDDRDAVSHADYLRFGCTLISRYEGILKRGKERVEASSPHTDKTKSEFEPKRVWRRVTAKFRGDASRLKAPKVLAILPLTQGLGDIVPMADVSADANPFLIVLDEIWFREYGPGECLDVEVVLETKEIGEAPEDERPFRVGPLPDHYVETHLNGSAFNKKRLYDPSTDKEQDGIGGNRHRFPVFGPFGHSLDRSGNEALANATAFIAFAPKGVAPHYAAFVRLRRVLQRVDGTVIAEGPPGATYALYTQPDAKQLIGPEDVSLQIEGSEYKGLTLDLRPAADTDPRVATQYRYLLIAGAGLHDFGRGSDLFLPEHAAWLLPGKTLRWVEGSQPLPQGKYVGRVLELLLNGRFPIGDSPLEKKDQVKTLRMILTKLFANEGSLDDAPAMIRRISPSFPLTLGKLPVEPT